MKLILSEKKNIPTRTLEHNRSEGRNDILVLNVLMFSKRVGMKRFVLFMRYVMSSILNTSTFKKNYLSVKINSLI